MKYIKLFEDHNYSIYDLITMGANQVNELFMEEIEKNDPNLDLIREIFEYSIIDVNGVKSYESPLLAVSKPLLVASESSQVEIVKIILEQPNVNPNKQDEFGFTPLMRASMKKSPSVAIEILKHPETDPNIQDDKSINTALSLAVQYNRVNIVKAILEHPQTNPNLRDAEEGEWTPLMAACFNKQEEIIKLLLNHPRIDKYMLSSYSGKNAYDIAVEEGCSQEILDMF